jgi:hypothetical protein
MTTGLGHQGYSILLNFGAVGSMRNKVLFIVVANEVGYLVSEYLWYLRKHMAY